MERFAANPEASIPAACDEWSETEARRGMYVHPTYAVTPEREPLGVLDAWMWAREKRNADGVRLAQKESTRWIEGYERIAEVAAQMPQTRLVYLADREADMVAMMRRSCELGTPADWLVRAKHNRCLPDEDGEKLWDLLPTAPRWARSPSRCQHAVPRRRAWYASNCGRARSISPMASAGASTPPVSWRAKSERPRALSHSNGGC
jgi:hypothetical protein